MSSSLWRRPQWRIPKYVHASLLMSFGGLLFGLDTGTIGPVSAMASFQTYLNSSSPTIHGLVVSSILIPAALSSFFAGHLADRLGRPRAITVGAFIFAVGAAVEASTIQIAMFFVGRVITGIGEGLFLSTVVVYICEIAPVKGRGPLTCLGQLMTTVGIFLGYFVAYGTVKIDSTASWRLPLALQSFLAFVYSVACLFLPHSPRWLALCGRNREAALVWDKLEVPREEREVEETDSDQGTIHLAGLDSEEPSSPDHGSAHAPAPAPIATEIRRAAGVGYLRVFAKDVGGRTALAVFLMAMQQLSGIDGVLYYAPLLFRQAGLKSDTASFLASGISAVLIMAVTIPGFLLADHWGRRTSAITGGSGLTFCMLLIGALYAAGAVHANQGAARWVVIAAIYIFAVIFSVTWALCLKVYASEIQPRATRAVASSLGQSANWITNFFVALVTPIILARSSYGAYFLFGCSTLLTTVVCVIYMPETKGKTLESINRSFESGVINHGLRGLRQRTARW